MSKQQVTCDRLVSAIAELEGWRDQRKSEGYGGRLSMREEFQLEAYRALLAVMYREPVAWTDEQELRDLEKSGCAYLFTVNPIAPNADPRRVIRLYTAPPAQIDLPESEILLALRLLSAECDTGERRGNGSQQGVAMPSWTAVEGARILLERIDNEKAKQGSKQ